MADSPNLRLLNLLEVIAMADRRVTAADLASHTSLPKPTIHRLLKTMQNAGFLEKQGQYVSVANRAVTMASHLNSKHHGNIIRHQVMRHLASKSGETINYVVPSDRGMSYVDRVETDWHFRVMLPIGTEVPFHCTASGKTFLASLRRSQTEAMLRHMHLDQRTNQTITDQQTLFQELKTIRKQGYSIDNEELYDNMLAIAVPVVNAKGAYCGALAIHGPKDRFGYDNALDLLPDLQEAAKDISDVLFKAER